MAALSSLCSPLVGRLKTLLWSQYPFTKRCKHLAVTPGLLSAWSLLWPSSWPPSPPRSEELALASSEIKHPLLSRSPSSQTLHTGQVVLEPAAAWGLICLCRIHLMAGRVPQGADRAAVAGEMEATFIENLRYAADILAQVMREGALCRVSC